MLSKAPLKPENQRENTPPINGRASWGRKSCLWQKIKKSYDVGWLVKLGIEIFRKGSAVFRFG